MPIDFSRMSIWYKAEVGDDDSNVKFFLEREYAEERSLFDTNGRSKRFSAAIGSTWYYETDNMTIDDLAPTNVLSFDHNNLPTFNGQSFPTSPIKTKPLGLFKPLPPIPQSEDENVSAQDVTEASLDRDMKPSTGARINGVPFDYMFADADETEVSTIRDEEHDSLIPSEMVNDEDDVVSDDFGPSTPAQAVHHQAVQAHSVNQVLDLTNIDTSAVHTHAFLVAGIPTTTTDLIENHILALGTNLAAPFSVDEEHEAEKARATDLFFNGPVEESPSPFHAPLLQDETGYGDVREGAEDFPELWNHIESELKIITCAEADTLAPANFDNTVEATESILPGEPAVPETKPGNVLFGLAASARARKAKQAAPLASVDVVKEPPNIVDLTVDEKVSETSSGGKKRRARSSSNVKPTFDSGTKDDEAHCLYTKKVRVVSDEDDDEVFSARRPSIYSLITQHDDSDVAADDALRDDGLLSRSADLKGFNGQFHGLPTSEQAERAKKLNAQKVPVYMGQAHHLNNLILHKDIHACPTFETTEYSPASAPPDSDIGRCISYANERADKAADMARTPAEQALRKEAHRECCIARLHGVAVGFYRYFQGHLTVEEYHERSMCICWQICECSKMCTRFADMICPCVDKIETNCR